ncbi:uncharacterized protein [Clytia hemisphaerica]|uniref:Cnidarian restricted protein n=1 Tax=Clytia hemisphaerica TaxID=252671 RepID=A0A7M5XEM2_9CNID
MLRFNIVSLLLVFVVVIHHVNALLGGRGRGRLFGIHGYINDDTQLPSWLAEHHRRMAQREMELEQEKIEESIGVLLEQGEFYESRGHGKLFGVEEGEDNSLIVSIAGADQDENLDKKSSIVGKDTSKSTDVENKPLISGTENSTRLEIGTLEIGKLADTSNSDDNYKNLTGTDDKGMTSTFGEKLTTESGALPDGVKEHGNDKHLENNQDDQRKFPKETNSIISDRGMKSLINEKINPITDEKKSKNSYDKLDNGPMKSSSPTHKKNVKKYKANVSTSPQPPKEKKPIDRNSSKLTNDVGGLQGTKKVEKSKPRMVKLRGRGKLFGILGIRIKEVEWSKYKFRRGRRLP